MPTTLLVPDETRTLGYEIIRWCQRWITQPDGPDAGLKWKFTPEQMRMVLQWYSIDDAGRFLYRRGVIRRMKGWGKDPFLAALSLVEACGPVRFGGWDPLGKPIAVQHNAPLIQIAAVAASQTTNTMVLFPGMIDQDFKTKFHMTGSDVGKEIIHVRGGKGSIRSVTSSPRAIEGARPTLVVLNETHHWLQANEGLAMADVVRRNLAKSRDGSGRSMEITNAHLPGEGSVAEATYDAVQLGDLKGVWYDSLEAAPINDLTDKEAVEAAIRYCRGDSYWVDPERLYEEINDPLTPEYVAKRFYLNQVVVVDIDRWLPQGAWASCSVPDTNIPPNTSVVLGFDGSYNGDATALTVTPVDLVDDNVVVELVGLWERPLNKPDWKVPRQDVMQTIRDACAKWDVVEIAADPALWNTDLEKLVEEGYPVATFQQRGGGMVAATQNLYEVVVGGKCRHNGNADLSRHIANAYVKDPLRPRLEKEHGNSHHKIDAAVACIMAVQRALEIRIAGQYTNVYIGESERASIEEQIPGYEIEVERGMRLVKPLTEEDYLVPNQFNLQPRKDAR